MSKEKEKEMEMILHKVCKKMMEQEQAEIEEGMKEVDPHRFSDIFEWKMKKLLNSVGKNQK